MTLLELAHNDIDGNGGVNSGALGLSVECVVVGAFELGGVAEDCVIPSEVGIVPPLVDWDDEVRRSWGLELIEPSQMLV